MTAFNFGGINETSAVNTSKTLKPWGIYEVSFDGVTRKSIKGKKDPDKTYDVIEISFSGEEGSFSTSLFVPNSDQDIERKVNTSKDGHEYQLPSRFEEFKWTLLQIAQVVNPEGYVKIKEKSSAIKTMDDFIKIITVVANAKKGFKTKLKLVGRNNNGVVYAQLPRVCGINKSGECFVSNNFIGDRVEFTSWEASQAKEYNTAKPTVMDPIVAPEPESSDDIDFDSLL